MNRFQDNFFNTKIEFLKGVGPQKASALNKELKAFTVGDLLHQFPFRYEDRSVFNEIREINSETETVQLKGNIRYTELSGDGKKKRFVGHFSDGTGELELVWFTGIKWLSGKFNSTATYKIYGKVNYFNGRISIAHPEVDVFQQTDSVPAGLHPVYHSTELLKKHYLDSKGLAKLIIPLAAQAEQHFEEILPFSILKKYKFPTKGSCMFSIHSPKNEYDLRRAQGRLKYEELFFVQMQLLIRKIHRKNESAGMLLKKLTLSSQFLKDYLPFPLTNAQKRVLKEIREDVAGGKQMNRLLQGDVGSGKTIVAFITCLMAIDNGAQACIMAPTEILADQHYQGLKEYCDVLGLRIEKLVGSTKKKQRILIHELLKSGELHIIVGTHALLEDVVEFNSLGMVIIDEQHKFGVAQRSLLWKKNKQFPPHILVMSATPIPRTLAMTFYGDLDLSVIDELPAGRKPIETIHKTDSSRLWVFGFLKEQLKKGRQVYIVFPLIEESATLDLKDLTDGYESMVRAFPEYHNKIGCVHGRQKPADKEFIMERFKKGETLILVATTVIEVGVNVPNASVMVIESAERFGLAQLHQLRGRVGRGAEQSYCILMTGVKMSQESKNRIATMVRTQNGFEIADADLKLRGAGDLMGTQQSGAIELKIADLATDGAILNAARADASEMLENDARLENIEYEAVKTHLKYRMKDAMFWGNIS